MLMESGGPTFTCRNHSGENKKVRIRLIHWKDPEAEEAAERLAKAGYEVDAKAARPGELRDLRRNPPDVFIIGLSRLPSQGRDIAVILRRSKATRGVPLVFAGGGGPPLDRVRQVLPDAFFADWKKIVKSVARAAAERSRNVAVPASGMAGYSGKPLAVKLGIKPGSRVVLIDAPDRFERVLNGLPEGVDLAYDAKGPRDLTILFSRSAAEFEAKLPELTRVCRDSRFWVAWPKLTSRLRSDLREPYIREKAIERGFVDYKVCAIDETWSGLLFTKKK